MVAVSVAWVIVLMDDGDKKEKFFFFSVAKKIRRAICPSLINYEQSQEDLRVSTDLLERIK